MGLWTFLWLQAFAKSKYFSFWKKSRYLSFYKVQIFEQDGKKERKEEVGQVGQVGQGPVPAVYIGVQDKDSTHTRPTHSALITSINCFRRNKCVYCSPRKGLSRTRIVCKASNFGRDYFCLLWKTCAIDLWLGHNHSAQCAHMHILSFTPWKLQRGGTLLLIVLRAIVDTLTNNIQNILNTFTMYTTCTKHAQHEDVELNCRNCCSSN